MKKLKPTKRVGVVLLTMCFLWLVACKRDQLQPPTPSILNTYRGTDKMVLQVIETLKEPVNKALLAELERQGSVNWEYKALITSRFLEGITLRFATGGKGNYLDAEVNAETRMIKLYSKQQQEQRDAMAEQAFSKNSGANSTQTSVCTFKVSFEVEVLRLNISELFYYLTFSRLLLDILSAQGFNVTSVVGLDTRATNYAVTFEPKNNETEADIRSLLVNSIEEYCKSREQLPNSRNCSWMIDRIKLTNSCWDGTNLDTVMHRLPANRLPANNNGNLQSGAMCVFKTMEWIAKYYGKNLSVNTSSFYYLMNLSGISNPTIQDYVNVINQYGVRADRVAPLLGNYFSYSPSGHVKTGLMSGFPVFCAISTVAGSVYHAVMATGYTNDGTIEYYDPQTGRYHRVAYGYFSYIFTITGTR